MSAPDRLTIIHVAAPAPVGGLERVVTSLATGHGAAGHDVHVVSILDEGGSTPPLAAGAAGVSAHSFVLEPRRYRRERSLLRALLAGLRPSIVHTHGYRPDVVDSPVAREAGIAAVSTVHGFTGGGLKNRFFERLQVRAFRRLDAVVAVSRPLVARLTAAGVPERLVHCIPNAWGPARPFLDRGAARAALGIPDDGPVAGWIGRLSREKAPDLLVEALGRLGADAPRGVVVGEGPLTDAARARAAGLGLADRVTLAGRVADAATLMRAFDVLVLSSRTEGTPIVLLEAMAAGVPVVATRVGGVPDVVSDREAVLVPPEDPAALAEAVRQVLRDPASAAVRAAAARERVASVFAVEPWLARYEALYRSVLARGRA